MLPYALLHLSGYALPLEELGRFRKTTVSPRLLAILAYEELAVFEFGVAVEFFVRRRAELGVPWYRTVVVPAEARRRLRGMGGVSIEPNASHAMLARARTIKPVASPHLL
jgi:hypothetical protein